MPKDTYKIISTIYTLLGEYDSRQLRDASREKGLPKAIRFALKALADEAEIDQVGLFDELERIRSVSPDKRRKKPSNGSRQAPSLSPALPKEIYKQNLSDFLSSKTRFRSKQELVEFAFKVGFRANVNPKDSRKRVERRIVSHAMKSSVFRKKLNQIVPNDWAKQTSGWLDLILRDK